jgi:hypothetical protein
LPGWITRADMPSAQAEALTRKAEDRLVVDEVALTELVLDKLVRGGRARAAVLCQHHQPGPLVESEFAEHVLDAERIVIGRIASINRVAVRSMLASCAAASRALCSSRMAMAASSYA